MNVNLSPRQLADPTLAKTVARILAETGVDPNAVCLELTENALMQNAASATEALRALRNLGVHLSIDDFGTGYSSLSYLKRFPVDGAQDRPQLHRRARDATTRTRASSRRSSRSRTRSASPRSPKGSRRRPSSTRCA